MAAQAGAEAEAGELCEAERSLQLGLNLGPESGQGTSGVIYPVLNALDKGRYVVKKVPSVFQSGQSLDQAAFLEEVRLHRLCSFECSAIVRYVFAYQVADALIVLMEACDVALWDALTRKPCWTAIAPESDIDSSPSPGGRQGRPSDFERCAWSNELCRAIDHCHALLVLHRDVNPWNVFLARQTARTDRYAIEGEEEARFSMRLGDFGLAVQLRSPSQQLDGIDPGCGVPLDESALTSLYSAPELGQCYGFAADVFSLGMTLFAIWNAPACRDEDDLIDAVLAAKDAVVVAKDACSENGVPSLLSASSLRRVPLQLNEYLVRMLHPSAASRPSAAECCVAVRQRLLLQGIRGPEEAITRVVQTIRRQFHTEEGKFSEKVPRQFLLNLMSELMHCSTDESGGLLAAAEVELGWKSAEELIDYKQFLTWVFSS